MSGRHAGRSGRSRVGVAVLAAFALAFAVSAAPAQATVFGFAGDKGTTCAVDVNAVATDGINGLQLPHIGFSAEPECAYPGATSNPSQSGGAGAGTPASALSGVQAKCKKKKGKARKRCKRKLRKAAGAGSARAAARVANPVGLDQGNLRLVGPLGIFLPGDKSLLAIVNGGFACTVDIGQDCGDGGNLTPAIPLLPFYANFAVRLTAPAGENWTSVPAGCSGGHAATCVLNSEPVTVNLLLP